MNSLPLAFLLGLLGSMHCAVMCGPLMLSLPYSQHNTFNSAVQLLMYQIGRTLAYATIGFLAGLLGSSIKLLTNQETLGIVIGSLMLLFAILHFTGRNAKKFDAMQKMIIRPISNMMSKVYQLNCWGLLAGLLNGLIPCGMVYLASATALNTGSVREAIVFMLLFGIGTTPLMLTISLGGIYLKKYIHFSPNKLIPWFMLLLGAIFILRSADIGIPYLSPDNQVGHQGLVSDCR